MPSYEEQTARLPSRGPWIRRRQRGRVGADTRAFSIKQEEVVAKLGLLLSLDPDDQTLAPFADSFLTELLAIPGVDS